MEQKERIVDGTIRSFSDFEWIISGGTLESDNQALEGLVLEDAAVYGAADGVAPIDLLTINPLTERVIGCAMRVHRVLGNGFQEVIYQRALAVELKKTPLHFAREQEMPIYYDGEQIGTRRADFLIENRVLVELKAVSQLTDDHYAQIINYLEAYRLPVGLLINFGQRSLTFKRFIKTLRPPSP